MATRGKQRVPTSAERATQLAANKKLAADLGKPRNDPVLKNEGQGLSQKQTADLERAVEQALQWCRRNKGAKYEDPDFPPGDRALYGSQSAEHFPEMPQAGEVAGWQRPLEFMPGQPLLWKEEWRVENIRQGLVNDRWLISAINIVSANTEQLQRAFLDPTRAADGGRVPPGEASSVHTFGSEHGFYVCRFFQDDPLSDDDWAVVVVDDRLPISALHPGTPCFAAHPDPRVYWGMILEKAAAKLAGSYAQLRGGTVKQGLKLLTGGHVPQPPRLNSPEGQELIPPSRTPNALWNLIIEKTSTNHVVGAAHAAKEGADLRQDEATAVEAAERMGLVARRAYAIIACGEAMGFKLLKLRLPLAPEREAAERAHLPSEWVGRFSDESDDWRPQLRQMLSYSKNSADNTFWMMYEDFCKYFNKVYICRMADDVWTKFVITSRWMDETAGGPPGTFLSWRGNFQWLLTVTARPVQVTITLQQPDVRKSSGNGRGYATAIGIWVLRGNAGGDARRRKLLLQSPDDVVRSLNPRFSQEVMLEVTLDPSPRPYVVLPCAHAPGVESLFKLTIHADDANDDGVPDFDFAAVSAEEDWQCSAVHGEWVAGATAGGGPPAAPGWLTNPMYQLKVDAKCRVYAFLEVVDVDTDGRDEAGMQTREDKLPELGLVAAAGIGDHVRLDGPPQVVREAQPRRAEGVCVHFDVDARTDDDTNLPIVLVPYTRAENFAHKFVVTVYTDVGHTLEKVEPRSVAAEEHACEYCSAPAVIYKVLAKIEELEAKAERLRILERQFVERGVEHYANKDADHGPGWDAFNEQKAQLDAALQALGGHGSYLAKKRDAPGPTPHAPGPPDADADFRRLLGSLEDEARRRLRDCPDVSADLGSLRIVLRRAVEFGGGRATFANAAADRALLEQAARAVTVGNMLLKERGRGPMHVILEGYLSANMPCFLPCCARYQQQLESAPNCLLARARAQACKEVLASRLAELDETGWIPTLTSAAALVFTRGYRYSPANALPGFDDGNNHPENRRVEMRILTPSEAQAEARVPDLQPNDWLVPEPPAPAPAPDRVHEEPGVRTMEELARALDALSDEVARRLGPLTEVDLDLPRATLRWRRPPRFVGQSARFANAQEEDGKMSEAARVIGILMAMFARDGLGPFLTTVIAFPPEEPPTGPPVLSASRADACASLLAQRLAEHEGMPAAEARGAFVAVPAPDVHPLPRDPVTRAWPVDVEARFVTKAEFERLVGERRDLDEWMVRERLEADDAAAEEARKRREAEAEAEEDARRRAAEEGNRVAPAPPPPPLPAPAAAPTPAPHEKRAPKSRLCAIL